ncbi:Subtilisin-like protease SBT1.8 [Cocos nucifera]|uniref:Subtilisin-like protease SBT1.8 n=1 Tax=Cocos nucifera TaxID=13894 RepID=A0A8K0NCZ5_COCNU|nr:Subtilisin-like protease SBT1.8 [Cocos nucifera]
MASFSTALFMSFLSFALFFQPLLSLSHVAHPQPSITTSTATTTYIIHTDNSSRPPHLATQTQWYSSILQSLSSTNTTTSAKTHSHNIIYTYDTILHGFAAILSSEEAERVSEIPGVVGVYKDTIKQLQTTRSPDFLGLNHDFGLWPESNFGEDVIIGLVDTGIWPESESFNDDGLPEVPSRWKGECESGERFSSSLCNKKLIGARWFLNGARSLGLLDGGENEYFQSPRDDNGHGTHTSSTAAGSPVSNASFFGFANGTARGMAPRARVAMYKACWPGILACPDSDILAAMDNAVKDGVDILSLSIGSYEAHPFDADPIAIGSFNAVRSGIFVVCAAGNSGPFSSSVSNVAPWITSVGAGSLDRKFNASITLGDGTVIIGKSLYAKKPRNTQFRPLVYLLTCSASSLVPGLVRGKIVVCFQVEDYDVGPKIQAVGGAGLIWVSDNVFGTGRITPLAFTLPALTVGYLEGRKILAYVNSTLKPKAKFGLPQQTIIGENRAPMVASFSSRGPNTIVPEILKPDILAPGINILAAWSPEAPLVEGLKWRGRFNIVSGTSMACPHVAGIAALLRQAHREWSPAMIRSALMTTAAVVDNQYRPILDEDLEPATPMAFGAGHVYPPLARDPGLVYDAGIQDYIDLLCAMNYTEKQLRKFGVGKPDCSTFVGGGAGNLNYPSFVVIFGNGSNVKVLKRSLTKVSELPEVYTARVVNPTPDKVEVTVEPERLDFKIVNEERSYAVKFVSKVVDDPSEEYGYIIWENAVHQVKSPVVFMWQ